MTFAVTYLVSYVAMCTHNQVFHNTLSFIAKAACPTHAPFPIMFVLLSSKTKYKLWSLPGQEGDPEHNWLGGKHPTEHRASS